MNLKLNQDKCKIRMSERKYKGHVLSGDGLKTDQDKIKSIVSMSDLQEKKTALMWILLKVWSNTLQSL